MKKYEKIQLANWRTGKVFKSESFYDLRKRICKDQSEENGLYPVLNKRKVFWKDYCLLENLSQEYTIRDKNGKIFKFKNWIKFAKSRDISLKKFKEVLDGRLIYYKGFHLNKNKNIIPRKPVKLFKIELKGKNFIIENLREFSEENKISYQALRDVASGRVARTQCGAVLKAVYHEEIK